MVSQAKEAETKLEAQLKKTAEANAKADAAREAMKASQTAATALEQQLLALQVVVLCSTPLFRLELSMLSLFCS